ncbi:hypothetical protein HK100_002188 [Physocladia obscura]|uniref:J domain-containing protein n=1 Tax=Physocladia obscura TaxID=109957 RepID=A0AAD5TBH1_9FUNG|nr:hypothetical protein HK100_002188 [Physocladia obscura]
MQVTQVLWSLLLWAYLPRLATNWLNAGINRVFFPDLSSHDPRFRRNWQLVFTLVVASYLFYSVVQVERGIPPNFYAVLNMTPASFSPKSLKVNYRALSLSFHPDKNPAFNDHYILIRKAYEVLKDANLKLAYDKFGIAAIEACRGNLCKSERDYIYNAFLPIIYFYGSTAIFLAFYTFIGVDRFGSFWRYVGLAAICSLELSLIIERSDILAPVIAPWRTTHERIVILRQLFVVWSIAIGQVGPVWFGPAPDSDDVKRQQLAEIEQLTAMNLNESQLALAGVLAGVKGDSALKALLAQRMEKVVLDSLVTEAISKQQLHAESNNGGRDNDDGIREKLQNDDDSGWHSLNTAVLFSSQQHLRNLTLEQLYERLGRIESDERREIDDALTRYQRDKDLLSQNFRGSSDR